MEAVKTESGGGRQGEGVASEDSGGATEKRQEGGWRTGEGRFWTPALTLRRDGRECGFVVDNMRFHHGRDDSPPMPTFGSSFVKQRPASMG